MAHDVFVSHSVKDKAVADAIVARLEADSVTCWIAPRDVIPGADWGESIIDAIESSRIMILIFSRSADASSQIKREVERAVNKGVYIIPFRVDDIPPTKSLEYFISTSQWMDAFSPPLERHLDNLAKTVTVVLKRPALPAVNVPAQAERPSTPKPPIRPSWRKSLLIAITIAALVIVGGMGWYLVQKKKGAPERPALAPTPVPTTPAAVTPGPTLVPIPASPELAKQTPIVSLPSIAPTATPTQQVETPALVQAAGTPQDVLQRYFRCFAERDPVAAYKLLSVGFRSNMSFKKYSTMFSSTREIQLDEVKLLSQGEKEAMVFTRFREADVDYHQTYWQGPVELVHETDGWRIKTLRELKKVP
jgi:hypothetical protein